MSTIRIGLTRSGAREENNLRINASIWSAFGVGSVAGMASFFVYNSRGPSSTFRATFVPSDGGEQLLHDLLGFRCWSRQMNQAAERRVLPVSNHKQFFDSIGHGPHFRSVSK
jgi:hypothetical protein